MRNLCHVFVIDEVDPVVSFVAGFGRKNKSALRIVPINLSVAPGLSLMTIVIIFAELFLSDF